MLFFKRTKGLFITAAMSLALFIALPVAAQAADYTVRSGDTLYKLGLKFNTTSAQLKKTNNLTSDMIYPGQVLNVPSSTYTVKSGDSLYLIAKKHNISLSSLRAANNKWNDAIYPGQKLILPGVGSGQSQSSSSVNSGSSNTGSVIPYTAKELDLLARLIMAETDGEPYEAKVGVGAVVVNRVKGPEFANTITSVIYEVSGGYYQFTPVENGWINKPASPDCIKAAQEALKGRDPSNGALFYFDDSATNKWLWSKPILARIGHMVYVK